MSIHANAPTPRNTQYSSVRSQLDAYHFCAFLCNNSGKTLFSPHSIHFTPSPTSVPAPGIHTTTLQPLTPMRRQPRTLASSCIPTHFTHARMHYELCKLAWEQRVVPNLPSPPHMRTRVLKRVCRYFAMDKMTRCCTRIFGFACSVPHAEQPSPHFIMHCVESKATSKGLRYS